MILLNFSHPLTPAQQQQIAAITSHPIAASHHIACQMDNSEPFAAQIRTIANAIPLTSAQWQSAPILVNPPAYAPAAAAMLAELHGHIGHFPAIIRIRPIVNSLPTQYEVAEIVDLQTIRNSARTQRE